MQLSTSLTMTLLQELSCTTRDVILCNISCNLPYNTFLNSIFYWPISRNIARQVAREILQCAMATKCIVALQQSLQIVEPDSILRNSSCNKNVVRGVTACNFDCNLCHNKIARGIW